MSFCAENSEALLTFLWVVSQRPASSASSSEAGGRPMRPTAIGLGPGSLRSALGATDADGDGAAGPAKPSLWGAEVSNKVLPGRFLRARPSALVQAPELASRPPAETSGAPILRPRAGAARSAPKAAARRARGRQRHLLDALVSGIALYDCAKEKSVFGDAINYYCIHRDRAIERATRSSSS